MAGESDALPRDGRAPAVTARGQGGVDDRRSDIFFAAIETTRMPMVLSDPHQPDNPIVFANRAFLRMTGYERSEVVGRNCRFLQGVGSDLGTVEEIRRAVQSCDEVAVELLNYRKDGTTFWNALFISPVFDAEGRLVYHFASQLDVSRRRDAEDALHRARAMEAVGHLSGGLAHDFNNLLQVVTGHMEGLKNHAAASGDATLKRKVGAVSDAADRATVLAQRLLSFSRHQRPVGRVVSLNGLVSDLTGRTATSLGSAIRLETALDEATGAARLEPSQAEGVLLALVANARDALADGGTVRVETANLEVGAGPAPAGTGLAPGRYGVVTVSDTGTGMPEDVLRRATQPFFTTKPEGRGAGLGLSAARGFAERSGGALEVASEVGRGTVVRLYLPAAMGRTADRPAKGGRVDRGGGERVLVVDDRAEIAELARTMLEDLGYAVEVATDGLDALVRLGGGFDLLFSDLVMPGSLDGVSLAREAQRRQPGLKVLLTTGQADPAVARMASGGAYEVIVKPYRRADLAGAVRLALDGPGVVR